MSEQEKVLSMLVSMSKGIESLNTQFGVFESRMASVEARMAGLESRFSSLENSVRKVLKFVPTENADFDPLSSFK